VSLHTLVLVTLLLGPGALATRATAEDPALAPLPAEQPDQVASISAGLMSKVFLALVRDSLVPADPRVVGAAALAALPSDHARPLPIDFGGDAARDAAWLADRVRDLPPPWAALEAMARATQTAHTGLVTPQRLPALRALASGLPLSIPGFQFFPLADGSFGVTDLIAGASADRAGLRAGDVVRQLAGHPPLRYDGFWLATLPAGTEVALEIERAGQRLSRVLVLQGGSLSSVDSRLLDDQIAYVRIRWFARSAEAERDTATLVREALTKLAGQGARGLILDLRSALGGSGEVSIASALYDGDLIYSIRQPLSAPARPYPREGLRIWPARPVVVLVNELTVSAGEALALALRELGPAMIVGRTTGGGLTEFSRLPLAEGYALIYPTGMVFGPVTDALQPGYAVKPDVEVPNPDRAELSSGRDRQLETARALLSRGR
jgi:C-terminal processing protease CtpA/Prc